MSNAVLDVATERRSESATILQRSVCLTLSCHYLGNHRKVKTQSVVDAAVKASKREALRDADGYELTDEAFEMPDTPKSGIDFEQVRSTKRLVDNSELRPAMRVLEKVQSYLRSNAISAHRVFGDRTYLVPLAGVQEIDQRLIALQNELAVETELIALRYDAAVEKQREKLGPLFNRKDYRTAAEVRQAFAFDWSYVSFAAPENLVAVDQALFEATNRKYESKMAAAYDEVRLVLRETLQQLIGEVAKKLQPGPDGKPKVFRNTILDGLTEFLSTFKVRNITDDAELDGIVNQLHGLTRNLDPQQLRDMDTVRRNLANALTEASETLDTLVTTGRRAISFDTL